jgi:hypothetical protein
MSPAHRHGGALANYGSEQGDATATVIETTISDNSGGLAGAIVNWGDSPWFAAHSGNLVS